MVRTLTVVALLALLAGLSMGFFVAKAKDPASGAEPAPVDAALESKVDTYRQYYSLTRDQTQAIRSALQEYDQGLLDLLRNLRVLHKDEFKALADRADGRITNVLAGAGKLDRK